MLSAKAVKINEEVWNNDDPCNNELKIYIICEYTFIGAQKSFSPKTKCKACPHASFPQFAAIEDL